MVGKLNEIFDRFPRVYWVAQTFELLERGAYYSMIPIIVVHAIWNVGLPIWLGAVITVFMYPFQYGLPIFTGAVAEKVGYKKQIIVAFSILTSAYIFLAFAFNTITMMFAVMAVGIGIGTYKPLISSTVAKCTPDKDRNLAYSIYYWIVNLAAFLIPLIFAVIMALNIIVLATYYTVFLIGAGLVSINVLTALFIFEEVPRSGKVKTVGDVFNNIKTAMKDKKFVVMVLLIGGFWALYSTMLNALPLIMFGFGFLPGWFTVMLLGVFNPMTIIIAGIPLAKFIEKVESMRVVLAGIMIYLIGMAIIGYSLRWGVVIFGIIIVSIGEFIVAPGYMAFVSKLAPKDKVSAYVGCNFLSYLIGLLGGTFVFGLIVTYVGTELQMPHFFYGITISIGLALLIAFIVYYWTWGQDIIQRARKIRELEEGVSGESQIPPDYQEPILFRIFDNKMSVTVCVILIPIVLVTTLGMPTYDFNDPFEEPEEEPEIDWIDITFESTSSGYTNEDQSVEMPFTIGEDIERLTRVSCTLTWTDEPTAYFQGTNEPDEFQVSLQAPNGEIETSGFSNTGSVSASMEVNFTQSGYREDYIGQWVIIVEAGTCGDDSAFIPLLGLRTAPDDGNDWTMQLSYTYMAPEEE